MKQTIFRENPNPASTPGHVLVNIDLNALGLLLAEAERVCNDSKTICAEANKVIASIERKRMKVSYRNPDVRPVAVGMSLTVIHTRKS